MSTTLDTLSPRSRSLALISMLRRLASSGIQVKALPAPVTLPDGRVSHCGLRVHVTSTLSARDRATIAAHGQDIASILKGNPSLAAALAAQVSDYEAGLNRDAERDRLERKTPPTFTRREPTPDERARKYVDPEYRGDGTGTDDGIKTFLSHHPHATTGYSSEDEEWLDRRVTGVKEGEKRSILAARIGFARFIMDQDRRARGTDNCLGVVLDYDRQ